MPHLLPNLCGAKAAAAPQEDVRHVVGQLPTFGQAQCFGYLTHQLLPQLIGLLRLGVVGKLFGCGTAGVDPPCKAVDALARHLMR